MGGSRRNKEGLDWCTFLFQKTGKGDHVERDQVPTPSLLFMARSQVRITFRMVRILREHPHRTNMFTQQRINQFCRKIITIKPRFLCKGQKLKKLRTKTKRGKWRLWHRYLKQVILTIK